MSRKIGDRVVDKFDVRVLGLIIFMSVVEFEVFVFARGVVAISEQDAWISILVGTAFLAINAYILVSLASRFPKENFFEYCPKVWGKPMAGLIKIGYLIYWFVTLSIIIEDFSTANKAVFLPETPVIVPILLLAIGAYWIVCYGLAAVTRFLQLMFIFLVIPLLLVAILGLSQVDIDNLKPFFGHSVGTIVKGGLVFAGIYQGLEIILFAVPFLNNKKKMLKHAVIGVCAGTFFPLVLGISAIGSVGVYSIKESVWPGIDTVSMIALPGFPVERYELFLTMPWLIATFTTICIFLYLLSYGIKEVFHIKYRKVTIALSVLLAVIAARMIPNYAWALKIRNYLTMATFAFIAILPLLTLIVAIVRRKEEVH
mgnify:FL=1